MTERGQDMTRLTCPRLAVSLHPHEPRRRAPRGRTHRVAVLLSPAHPLLVRSLFLFLANFPFLRSSRRALTTILADGRAAVPPLRAYHVTTSDRDDDGRGCGTTRHHAARRP
jgi:hypothetical protein